MSGSDAGDELAEQYFSKVEGVLEHWALYGGAGRGGKTNLRLWARFRNLVDAMRQSRLDALQEWYDSSELDGKAYAYAAGKDGLMSMAANMSRAGLGGPPEDDPIWDEAGWDDGSASIELPEDAERAWDVGFDERSGLWRVSIDEDVLRGMPRDFRDYFESCSLDNVEARLALSGACSQAASEMSDSARKADFKPGTPGNKVFGFKTVKWDPDGQLMAGYLEDAEIPFSMSKLSDDVARFEIGGSHAPAVTQIADVMCKTVKGMAPERFEFPEGFDGQSQVGKKLYRATLELEPARILMNELQAHGIEYHASSTGVGGQVEVVANIEDVDALKGMYESVRQREVAVVSPEQAATMQLVKEARSAGNRAKEQKKAKVAIENAKRESEERTRKRSIEKDQDAMERSARQRSGMHKAPKRSRNVSKGGM